MNGWQPIETAPCGQNILVCDARGGKPYTIASVVGEPGAWCYEGGVEQVDFAAEYWLSKDVDRNPFHIGIPAKAHIAMAKSISDAWGAVAALCSLR